MSINKVIILGRLGQDPELKYTPQGIAVCNFSVATSEELPAKNGAKQEKTEWHKIVVWGLVAENCHQFLKKGSQIYLEGKIQTRFWIDQKQTKRYVTEIIASKVEFLSTPNKQPSIPQFAEDDIPF